MLPLDDPTDLAARAKAAAAGASATPAAIPAPPAAVSILPHYVSGLTEQLPANLRSIYEQRAADALKAGTPLVQVIRDLGAKLGAIGAIPPPPPKIDLVVLEGRVRQRMAGQPEPAIEEAITRAISAAIVLDMRVRQSMAGLPEPAIQTALAKAMGAAGLAAPSRSEKLKPNLEIDGCFVILPVLLIFLVGLWLWLPCADVSPRSQAWAWCVHIGPIGVFLMELGGIALALLLAVSLVAYVKVVAIGKKRPAGTAAASQSGSPRAASTRKPYPLAQRDSQGCSFLLSPYTWITYLVLSLWPIGLISDGFRWEHQPPIVLTFAWVCFCVVACVVTASIRCVGRFFDRRHKDSRPGVGTSNPTR